MRVSVQVPSFRDPGKSCWSQVCLGCQRRPPDPIEDCEEFIQLRRSEQPVGSSRGDVGKRRLVQERGTHQAVFGQVVDNQVDELDLVSTKGLLPCPTGNGAPILSLLPRGDSWRATVGAASLWALPRWHGETSS